MSFGKKLKKLREEKGISQLELARCLGYKTNSYISDVERGDFIPSTKKLKAIAQVLGLPFSKLKDLLLEARLEALGIKEPGFISLFKDYPHLTKKERRAIINAYLKIKEKRS
jgi:transcriptional regulator with XRE-family HTH domain